MEESRRNFVRKGAYAAIAAGSLGMLSSCKSSEDTQSLSNASKTMVGACGLSCSACSLMKAGKCKGCGPANVVSAEMISMKNCPVLNCASMKKIAYCGTDCMKFTECGKLIGRPYDKSFMEKIKGRLG
ncbi:MAG: hypothetical protein J7M40_07265 [Planctomycetes bacterium]|nr:hypothetical protein [Planctomycetota bacterium]